VSAINARQLLDFNLLGGESGLFEEMLDAEVN